MRPRLTLLLAILAIPLLSCSSPAEQPGENASTGEQPTILVLLDGVRADRLGSYGAELGLTPNLDRFAAGAVRFDWAFAQAPQPAPSLASLLTALYPTTHGMVEGGDRLAEEARTAAEVLADAGYATAAFLESGFAGDDLGLGQGFETFQAGTGALEQGLTWLQQRAAEEMFLVVELPSASGTAAETYDDAVAAADAAFGRLLVALDSTGLAGRATVAVVSLAGKDLEPREGVAEPSIYAPVTRVPMLLASPGVAGGAAVDKIVEVVDLAPTLLELAGESAPPETQGRSLLPLIEGAGTPPYVAFGESPAGGGEFFAALGGYRMVIHGEDDSAELYDLTADPLEATDLAAGDERRVSVLRDHLGAWRKMTAASSLDPERRVEELDDDTLDQLKSLGYIQ
jgi:arylsulfatase A-like enzyme